MKIIGITGPTGAGKTTALRVLRELGAVVIDCDEVYHTLLENSSLLREELQERFGADILDEMGKIDRKRLGGVVFSDEQALEELNEVTHRYVRAEVFRAVERARAAGLPAAAIDAIALIESGLAAECDAVVGVLAPAEVRIRRIMVRDGISEAYARSRVAAQKGENFFRANCTHILENDGKDSPEVFAAHARKLFTQVIELF